MGLEIFSSTIYQKPHSEIPRLPVSGNPTGCLRRGGLTLNRTFSKKISAKEQLSGAQVHQLKLVNAPAKSELLGRSHKKIRRSHILYNPKS